MSENQRNLEHLAFYLIFVSSLLAAIFLCLSIAADSPAYVAETDSDFPKDAQTAATLMHYDGGFGAVTFGAIDHFSQPYTLISKDAARQCTSIAGKIDAAHIMTPEMLSYYAGGFDTLDINPPPPGTKLLTTRIPIARASFAVVPCDQVARRLYIPVYIAYYRLGRKASAFRPEI